MKKDIGARIPIISIMLTHNVCSYSRLKACNMQMKIILVWHQDEKYTEPNPHFTNLIIQYPYG